MTYVVAQSCCNDRSCISVCPVNCIHPTRDDPDFGKTEMVYVDPRSCIDCGACVDACPVSAIKPIDLLRPDEQAFASINADHFLGMPEAPTWSAPVFPVEQPTRTQPLRVAIVGTGPSASYVARRLLTSTSAQISIVDRLPVVGGLVRSGVAPDHQDTKRLGEMFEWVHRHPRTQMYLNVEVGTDVTHDELMQHHDAVVYGVGAPVDRVLDVPGEDMDGVHGAPEVVGWYNCNPDVDRDAIRPTTDRVVVVGNGNVALDMARILLTDVTELARTDIAGHALEALARSGVREVVLVGRRGPADAAFTKPELLMMPAGIDVVVAGTPRTVEDLQGTSKGTTEHLLAALPQVDADWASAPPPDRRVVLLFHHTVEEILGDGEGHVESVRLRPVGSETSDVVTTTAGLVLRATGYRGAPVPGLPFDEASTVIPHERGRVVDTATGLPVAGAYVVGWIKRGASGGIGTNRSDADETVDTLLADARSSVPGDARRSRRAFARMLRSHGIEVVDGRRARRIDAAERSRGEAEGRPRAKFATIDEMLRRR